MCEVRRFALRDRNCSGLRKKRFVELKSKVSQIVCVTWGLTSLLSDLSRETTQAILPFFVTFRVGLVSFNLEIVEIRRMAKHER